MASESATEITFMVIEWRFGEKISEGPVAWNWFKPVDW